MSFANEKIDGENRRDREIVTYLASHMLTHLVTNTILSVVLIHSNFVTEEFEDQEAQVSVTRMNTEQWESCHLSFHIPNFSLPIRKKKKTQFLFLFLEGAYFY